MPKKHSLYSMRTGKNPEAYVCGKLSEDLEVEGTYYISDSASGAVVCSCPAYKPWCRHAEILRLFQAEGRVNTGWLYNYDLKTWVEPMSYPHTV